jgi:hypothetical protein
MAVAQVLSVPAVGLQLSAGASWLIGTPRKRAGRAINKVNTLGTRTFQDLDED